MVALRDAPAPCRTTRAWPNAAQILGCAKCTILSECEIRHTKEDRSIARSLRPCIDVVYFSSPDCNNVKAHSPIGRRRKLGAPTRCARLLSRGNEKEEHERARARSRAAHNNGPSILSFCRHNKTIHTQAHLSKSYATPPRDDNRKGGGHVRVGPLRVMRPADTRVFVALGPDRGHDKSSGK